jgi:hypothetical protein
VTPDAAALGGLCPRCRHVQEVRTPRSVFLLCALSRTDSRFERYPRQPVLACPGYEPASNDEAPPGEERGSGD